MLLTHLKNLILVFLFNYFIVGLSAGHFNYFMFTSLERFVLSILTFILFLISIATTMSEQTGKRNDNLKLPTKR